MAEISPLRRRMIEDMTVRNLSPATQQSYLNAVSKFSRYFGRSPDRLGLEDVHAFQVHLVATGISWPALNQIVCALRFFYGVTLGQAIVPERIAYAREPSKLPVVLSADEVVRFLEAIPSLKSRTALTTVYAAGLRVSEVVLLKIADIDSQRMVIRVEQGKGGKVWFRLWRWRISSAAMAKRFDRRAPVISGASSDGSWAPSRRAGRRCSAAMSSNATIAVQPASLTTRAATVTVPNARGWRGPNGSRIGKPSCCQCRTFMSSSHCQRRSARSRFRTRPPSARSYSARRPRHWPLSRLIGGISARGSA
jgi:hypothetical protein